MFPRLRQQILARADLVLEAMTLGEYGVDESGATMRLEPETTLVVPPRRSRGCRGVAASTCPTAPDRALPARP